MQRLATPAADANNVSYVGRPSDERPVFLLSELRRIMAATPRIAGCPTVDFADIPPVPCPCGEARRAFADVPEFPGTVHVTDISADAVTHYHKKLTETYYFLECHSDAAMELNGERIAVQPGRCILIPPGVRHRAVGPMKVLIVAVPNFDPDDEWFD